MRRIPIVLLAEHPPADQRNVQGAKVLPTRNAIKSVSRLGRISSYAIPLIEIGGRPLAIQYEEGSIGEIVAVRDWKSSSQTYALDRGNRAKPGYDVFHLTDLPLNCCLVGTLYRYWRHWTRKFRRD